MTPFRSALPWALVPTVVVLFLLAVLDAVALVLSSVGYGASVFFSPALGGDPVAAPSVAEHVAAFCASALVALLLCTGVTSLTMWGASRGDGSAPALHHPRLVGLVAAGIASLAATAVLTVRLDLDLLALLGP